MHIPFSHVWEREGASAQYHRIAPFSYKYERKDKCTYLVESGFLITKKYQDDVDVVGDDVIVYNATHDEYDSMWIFKQKNKSHRM